MSVIKKLVTLLRGSARELGQSVVDGNATRIYEQEIIDAKASITESCPRKYWPSTASASSNAARACENVSTNSWVIPTFWLPCPGKRKAVRLTAPRCKNGCIRIPSLPTRR